MLFYFCSSGITNHDEYSLVRDIGEEKKEEITGTLKRDKTLLRDDKKMEKLKQKLHTDDERMSDCRQNWNPKSPQFFIVSKRPSLNIFEILKSDASTSEHLNVIYLFLLNRLLIIFVCNGHVVYKFADDISSTFDCS